MFYFFISEFKKKRIYLFFLFLLFVILFLSTCISTLVGVGSSVAIIYELCMIIGSFGLVTFFYKTYNKKIFLKTSYLSGSSHIIIMINIFFYIIFWLFIYSLAIIVVVYFMAYLNILSLSGIGPEENPLPTLEQLNLAFMIYSMFMYILIMVGIAFLLNSFFKKNNYIYGIIIVIFLFDVRFSLTTYSPLIYDDVLNSFVLGPKISYIPIDWSAYILPWSMIGIRMSELFSNYTYVYNLTFKQYYDISYIPKYGSYVWLPYLYLIVIYLVTFIRPIIIKNRE